ncbi:MAG TPA: hypothetical protein VFP84_10625 [Kofleriaceae bacterium]|nr:hypothetical protein [Kofleriaceae bacterium]
MLDLFTPARGVLVDPPALAFQIFDVSGDDKRAAPVQVFPSSAGTQAGVRTAATWPDGDKLGPGHFVARWTPSANESIGAHEIRWFLPSGTGAEQIIARDFDVVAEVAGSSTQVYALVSDVRAEGVMAKDVSDVRIARMIRLASQYVDRITGRFFTPRAMTLTVDGSGRRSQLLGHPIIGIGDVKMFAGLFDDLAELPVIPSFFRVFNRHLTQGLLDPDDRENPRLEFFHESDLLGVHADPAADLGLGSLVWLTGVQNVIIDGVFGYTDPDGSPTGRTPELIRHVTKLLVMRELPAMADFAWREDRRQRWRITSERTRDQSYNLDALRAQGIFTGDPEIDAILVSFQRPAQLGAV